MITDDQLNNYGIDKFLNNLLRVDIPLLAVIKIDNNTYGRVDILINKYYGGEMKYLKLLMAFNNISDPTEMKIGMIFEIPDIQSLLDQLTFNDILDDDSIIPGVKNYMTPKNTPNNVDNSSTNNPNKTIASKLNIMLKSVKYDSVTGITSY